MLQQSESKTRGEKDASEPFSEGERASSHPPHVLPPTFGSPRPPCAPESFAEGKMLEHGERSERENREASERESASFSIGDESLERRPSRLELRRAVFD